MLNFRFVILDIDGTIFDSKIVYRKMLKWVLNLGINSLLYQFYFDTLKENRSKLVFGLKRIIDNLIYVFLEGIDSQKPKIFEEAKEFLGKLDQRGIKVFASTSSSFSRVKEKMERADIFNFFELVLGRESFKMNHIELFAKHLNMDLKEFCRQSVLIGDEPGDMILGERFNIYRIIGISNTVSDKLLMEFGADRVVSDFKELMKL